MQKSHSFSISHKARFGQTNDISHDQDMDK